MENRLSCKNPRDIKKEECPSFQKTFFFQGLFLVCWLAAEKWLVFIGSYKRDMVSSLFPYIYCVILHTTVICYFLLSLVLSPNVMCTWWISVIMWWSSWRWMSGRRSTVSLNVWPSRLRWWLRKELGERQEARIKGSMKVENFLIMMYFPFLSFLPICTPPSRPINLMSLLCCDCLEGMRLEGHQGWLCVTLARGCWKSCCWFWLAKKASPKSVVSSSSSISRRLSCKKGDTGTNLLFFCYVLGSFWGRIQTGFFLDLNLGFARDILALVREKSLVDLFRQNFLERNRGKLLDF